MKLKTLFRNLCVVAGRTQNVKIYQRTSKGDKLIYEHSVEYVQTVLFSKYTDPFDSLFTLNILCWMVVDNEFTIWVAGKK